MKKNTILIIGFIIVLVGVAGYFVLNKQSSFSKLTSTSTSGLTPDTIKPAPVLSSEIIAIDNIKYDIDNLIKTGALHEKKKEFEYSIPYEPTLKAIYVDQENKVSKYIQEAGSDDSALKSNFYYDKSFKLRFVLITGGAVNGSELEHRIYFNENGERISESHEYINGPGYTFPNPWPESEIVLDPIKEYNR